jgi:CRISPR/Cas system-associated exonuclease Cas4 (RecB family)
VKLPDGHTARKARRPQDVDHLSFSSVSTYLRCPRQWAYAYLENIRRRPGVALIKGGAVDKAASANLTQKLTSNTDLHVDEVKEMAEDAFRSAVDREGGASEIDWDGQNQARALDSTIGLTDVHMRHHAPRIQPAYVQLELHRDLPDGRDFVGHIDYVTTDSVVGDVKTGSRRMGQDAADSDLQPSAYGFLINEPIAFEFARVIDTGTRRYEEVVTTGRDRRAIDWFSGLVDDVSRGINAAVFPPNPNGWHCSQKFCGYWNRCQLQNKPPEFPE